MSYYHPSAPVNSSGFNPDPMTPARLNAARERNDARDRDTSPLTPLRDLTSWRFWGTDVITFLPFDLQSPESRDDKRERRMRQMRDSHIPWVVQDATSILTFLDDVDDIMKSPRIAKDYLIKPAGRALDKLLPGGNRATDALDDWKAPCRAKARLPRDQKLWIQNGKGLEFLAALGLQALKSVFPAIRIALTVSQLLQATDTLFGMGVKLGPILGAIMEFGFRGAAYFGLPFGPEHNKYEQLKAARILQNMNRGLGAFSQLHPDDQLTVLHAIDAATRPEVLTPIVLKPDDYPQIEEIIEDLGNAPKEIYDLVSNLGILPYNLAAYALNDLINPAFERIAQALGIDPGLLRDAFSAAPDNTRDAMMRLAEKGILPCALCAANVWQTLPALERAQARYEAGTGRPLNTRQQALQLGYTLSDVE